MMMVERSIRVLYLCIIIVYIRITNTTQVEFEYYRYLQQYGYTPKVEGRRLFSILTRSSYAEVIRKFQHLYKLPETGQLDEPTKRFMRRARCGNPDLGTYQLTEHSDKRVLLSTNIQSRSSKIKTSDKSTAQINIWPKKQLKWFIEKYPEQQKDLRNKVHIEHIFNQSFYDWEKHSGLKFEMVNTKQSADLNIKFLRKDHSDGYPFDGPGATLAHAFYPTIGDIHFDDDEYFTDHYKDDGESYTLRLVAAHEIGHALGLSHSFDNRSLMYPIYQVFDSEYELSNDDQQNIQALYGKPERKLPTKLPQVALSPSLTMVHPSSRSSSMDNWCTEEFQTGCEGPDGELYIFKDDRVWRYQVKKHVWDSQPTLISERFPSLMETTITTCVKSSIGYTYFFRDYRIWQLKTHWAFDGPYILRSKNFPQNPNVALLHRNFVYFIHERLAFRLNEFDHSQKLEILPIDTILNPPPNESIESGFTFAKRHYIFTKDFVYMFDATHGSLLPGYPKPKANGWFACESASQKSKPNRKTTLTIKATTAQSPRSHHHENGEIYSDFDHHHHHHRPRRPSHNRLPPHEYRRRWDH